MLELGANDGLTGTPLKAMRSNMEKMLALITERDIPVLLFEMYIPANYGPAYTKGFTNIYSDLSKKFSATMVPFFLNGVAGVPELNQRDGIHPIAEVQQQLLDNVWPVLAPFVTGSTSRADDTVKSKAGKIKASEIEPAQ